VIFGRPSTAIVRGGRRCRRFPRTCLVVVSTPDRGVGLQNRLPTMYLYREALIRRPHVDGPNLRESWRLAAAMSTRS